MQAALSLTRRKHTRMVALRPPAAAALYPHVHVLISSVPWRRASLNRLLRDVAAQTVLPGQLHLIFDGTAKPNATLDLSPILKHGIKVTLTERQEPQGAGARWRVLEGLPDDDIVCNVDDDIGLYSNDYLAKHVAALQSSDAVSSGGYPPDWRLIICTQLGIPYEGPLQCPQAGVFSARIRVLKGLYDVPLASELLGRFGDEEGALSTLLWQNGIVVRRVNAPVCFDLSASDKRAQSIAMPARQERFRVRLRALTGWPWRVDPSAKPRVLAPAPAPPATARPPAYRGQDAKLVALARPPYSSIAPDVHVLIASVPWRRASLNRLLRDVAAQTVLPKVVHLVLDGADNSVAPVDQSPLRARGIKVTVEEHAQPRGAGSRWEVVNTMLDDDIVCNIDDDMGFYSNRYLEQHCTALRTKGDAVCSGGYTPTGRLIMCDKLGIDYEGPINCLQAGAFSARVRVLRGLQSLPMAGELLGMMGDDEAAIAALLWQKHVMVRRVNAPVAFDPCGFDSRSQFKAGPRGRITRLRTRLRAATGWPWGNI